MRGHTYIGRNAIAVFAVMLIIQTGPAWAAHSMTVLPFEDHSGFAGNWDLGCGISQLLSARLAQIAGYVVVDLDSLDRIEDMKCREGGRTENFAALFDSLKVGFLVCGMVEDFGISSFGIATPSVGGFQAYRAGVRVNFFLWERGKAAALLEAESKGEIKQKGLGLTFLGRPTEQMKEYEMLDRLEFGSETFMSTIAGKAIDTMLTDMVEKIKVVLPPQRDLSSAVGPAIILSVEDGQVYFNRGYEDEISPGDEFVVYTRGDELRDPLTDELLGYTDKRVGRIRVSFVKSAHLSRAEVVEEDGEIAAGDEVRTQ